MLQVVPTYYGIGSAPLVLYLLTMHRWCLLTMQARSTPSCPRVHPRHHAAAPPRHRAAAPPHRLVPGGGGSHPLGLTGARRVPGACAYIYTRVIPSVLVCRWKHVFVLCSPAGCVCCILVVCSVWSANRQVGSNKSGAGIRGGKARLNGSRFKATRGGSVLCGIRVGFDSVQAAEIKPP